MNDLIVLSRVQMIQAINMEAGYHLDKIKFFTFDKGLEFFLSCIETKKLRTDHGLNNTSTVSEISCSPKLFPELDKCEFLDLINSLQGSHNLANAANAKNSLADSLSNVNDIQEVNHA